METVYRHMKNKYLNSQQGSTKSKPCLTILIDFYDERTGFVDEGKGTSDLQFVPKAFLKSVSRIILVAKLRRCELDGWTTT